MPRNDPAYAQLNFICVPTLTPHLMPGPVPRADAYPLTHLIGPLIDA